jgi:hypothetical protein
MKQIALLLAALLATGILTGCTSKAERIYQLAADAVRQQATLPEGATILPMEQCKLFIGKSESTVVVFYAANGLNGNQRSYTVFLKDLGKRWVIDTCNPTPDFSTPSSPSTDLITTP